MPEPRGEHECVVVRIPNNKKGINNKVERIYCVGGFISNDKVATSTLSFDLQTHVWRKHSPPQVRRGHIAAVVLNDTKIFTFGGRFPLKNLMTTSTDAAEMYDVETDTWTHLPSIPVAPVSALLTTTDPNDPQQSIWLIGGEHHLLRTSINSVIQFFPHSNTYLCHPNVPVIPPAVGCFGGGAFFHDGLLHVLCASNVYGFSCSRWHFVYKPDPSRSFLCFNRTEEMIKRQGSPFNPPLPPTCKK
jgi:hypothetical protein